MKIEETKIEVEEAKPDMATSFTGDVSMEALGSGSKQDNMNEETSEGTAEAYGMASGSGNGSGQNEDSVQSSAEESAEGENKTGGQQQSQAQGEGQGQEEQDGDQEIPHIDPSIFGKVMSGMTEDQKMEFLNNLPPCFDEDQIRRIAYAVFQQEYSGIADEINIYTERLIRTANKKCDEILSTSKKTTDELIEDVKKRIKNIGKPTLIDVKLEDGTVKSIGMTHKNTEWLIKVLQRPRNVFLAGPAGSGKTTCAENVASALGLSFHPISVGPETMKSDLLGFIDANGNYHTTQVREAFEKGGLLLLDEIDAGNGASITILNSLLANGYCSFPDGVIKRHPNFRCIAAANTFGRGSDRLYVGRNQLDAATLDRFVVKSFDYDENFERQLAGNDAWVDRVQEIRHKAEELRLRVVVSPRASIIGATMLADGFSQDDVEEALIFKYDKEFKKKINS